LVFFSLLINSFISSIFFHNNYIFLPIFANLQQKICYCIVISIFIYKNNGQEKDNNENFMFKEGKIDSQNFNAFQEEKKMIKRWKIQICDIKIKKLFIYFYFL
jgi:hypothetical protein